MKKIVLIFVVLFLAANVHAGWIDMKGNSVADTKSMKSKGDFGTQVFTTLNAKEVYSEWAKKNEPVKINTSKSVKKDQIISVMFIFAGAKPDNNNKCDVTAKVQIIAPDGSVNADIPSIEVWQNKPALPPRITQLGVASIDLSFDQKDALGKYTVKAIVTDNISKTELSLETDFEVIK